MGQHFRSGGHSSLVCEEGHGSLALMEAQAEPAGLDRWTQLDPSWQYLFRKNAERSQIPENRGDLLAAIPRDLLVQCNLGGFFPFRCCGSSYAPPAPFVSDKSDTYVRSIVQLGGILANPMVFPETVEGFQKYLLPSSGACVTFPLPN